jgi:predicted acetyltransferase
VQRAAARWPFLSEQQTMFKFHDPGRLVDQDLTLLLADAYSGNSVLNYVPAYRFKMVRTGTHTQMGEIELRIGNTHNLVMYGGHIGYSVYSAYRGHHYAARSVRLLLPLAQQHALDVIWITCNPDNYASRRTCELAGFEFVEIVDLPPYIDMYQEGECQKCRYRLQLGQAVGSRE